MPIADLYSRALTAIAIAIAVGAACTVAFFFTKGLYDLMAPFAMFAGPDAELIYTAPLAAALTHLQLIAFATACVIFPSLYYQIYADV